MPKLKLLTPQEPPIPADYASVFRAAPGLYLLLMPDAPKYTIITASDAYAKATLTKSEELIGRGVFEVFPHTPDEKHATRATKMRDSLDYVIRELKAHEMEVQQYDIPRTEESGGGFDELHWSPLNTPVFDAEGKIQYIIHRVEDLTNKIRAEKERDRFFNVTTDLLVKKGFDGYFKHVNPEWERILGWTVDELLAKPSINFVHPEDVEKTIESGKEALQGKTLAGFENRYACKDGSYRWLLWNSLTVKEEKIVYCAATDITDIRQAEMELRESEMRFRQLANAMPQVVWSARPDGTLDYINDRCYEYSGVVNVEDETVDWTAIVHPEDLPNTAKVWSESLANGIPYEVQQRILHVKSGQYRWNLTRALPVRDNQGRITKWYGTNTDIEDQKRTEDKLRDKDVSLHTALQAGRMGTWELDVGQSLLTCSETCRLNYGLKPDDELTFGKVVSLVHKDDIDHWKAAVSKAIETASDFEIEYRIIWPDESIHWIYVRGSCTNVSGGKATMISGVSIDITERKKLEAAALEARENAELANMAKSEFLANMSHEIRTPMNAIIGLATILGKGTGLSPKQKEYVHTLQLSADSLLALINDLLDISKIEARSIELEHIPFSIAHLMNEIVSMMSLRAKEKGLEFAFKGESDGDRILIGDPARLRQIIVNLCSNAIKFTEKGGVYISVTRVPSTLRGIEDVSFSITDTGIGIRPDKQETIFQKFIQADSSINRKYGGTGLGLAITKTLTEIMHGTISLESTPGKGSTFTVTLPLMAGGNSETAQVDLSLSEKDEERVSPQHRVLLVEDYAANVLVAGSYLELFGYQYDVVDNGYQAVERAKTGNYLAILMDVQMHGINGFEATKLIRAHEKKEGKKRTPIIGMTAHALTGDRERCLAADMDFYLSKPYNPDELEHRLKRCSEAVAGKDSTQNSAP